MAEGREVATTGHRPRRGYPLDGGRDAPRARRADGRGCGDMAGTLKEDLKIEAMLDTVISMLSDSFVALESENTKLSGRRRNLTVELIEQICQQRNTRYSQDEHYDHASAFQKSLRGSDADAAIYYLAKMVASGEDPRFIARRLVVTAAEDVGNADTNALAVAMNAYKAVELLGFPEARIPLAQAVIYVARAPKSNETVVAIDKALRDIANGDDFPPPMHLRDSHYKDAAKYGFGEGYIYSHSEPQTYQQFLPDELVGRKYTL